MEIRKDYKFYAAHRNQDLLDKCSNIHGHVYRVSFFFKVERSETENISTLFGEFDDKIEPHLKEKYDHGMLADRNDPLFKSLCKNDFDCMKFKVFDRPTSVENLCYELYKEVTEMGFDISRLEVKETDSSTVIYTRDDYNNDQKLFNKPKSNEVS